jgi:hypothetical protein
MAEKASDAIKLNLRLSKPLHKRLKQQARRNNVSLNTEIVNQLEGHEAATAKRLGEIMQPWIDQAVRTAVTESRPVPHGSFVAQHILLSLRPRTEAGLERRLSELKAILDDPQARDDETTTLLGNEARWILRELLRLREARASLSPGEDEPFLTARLSDLGAKLAEHHAQNLGPTEEFGALYREQDMVRHKLQVVREAAAKEPQKK